MIAYLKIEEIFQNIGKFFKFTTLIDFNRKIVSEKVRNVN